MKFHEITTREEVDTVVDILTEAFADDPECRYLVHRTENTTPYIRRLYGRLIPNVFATHPHIVTDEDKTCALIWWKSGNEPLGFSLILDCILHLRDWLDITNGFTNLIKTISYVGITSQDHPQFPHLYLFEIGVIPSQAHKGIGTQLMHIVTDYADKYNYPVYLESSKEENVPFYQKHGFIVLERVQCFSDGTYFWDMLRPLKYPNKPSGVLCEEE